MANKKAKSVLILGGYGALGTWVCRHLRRLHPDLPITVGGRNPAKAEALVEEVGNAEAIGIDLARPDLGLPADGDYSLILAAVKDHRLSSWKYAQDNGIPYVCLSEGLFEFGPHLIHYAHKPHAAPIVMQSYWMAGAALMPAFELSREFETVDTISMAGILDPEDDPGPNGLEDIQRVAKASPYPLVLDDGVWDWVELDSVRRSITTHDGVAFEVYPFSAFDVLSLPAMTGARSVRTDMAVGESEGRRRGGGASHDIIVEISGTLKDGTEGYARLDIFAPGGASYVSAVMVTLTIERLLGLAGGDAPTPGIYFPELILDPVYVIQRLEDFGIEIRRA